ncbi:TetR/AcrR family transcriptional regulator [Conyzicola nivalis]|uniref:HTH-type transcriptional regulator PksA n=1 Tax=Conyzicola nivalis TaxID=1477021 RepID=A0A916WKZ4_9MICO|nr:TetR family transcriptional regulator C-terminal domain-containing protein [Conyzicola nivalis]GGB08010.1 HTH-type transcriptional regulator PksA [Conyzicola nivalis]
MPKIVDTAERNRIVSEAAWRVMVRDGLTALSVRNVAAEANLPPSSLRYTFPTQASVRDSAVALLVERMAERVARHGESGADDTAEADASTARAILLELLPLDDERRVEMEVSLALGAMAATDRALWQAHQRTHLAVREACVRALALLGADPRDVDGTHALIDGLALHLVRQAPTTGDAWALRALDAHLHRLRTPAG